jgi:hypothetical protein
VLSAEWKTNGFSINSQRQLASRRTSFRATLPWQRTKAILILDTLEQFEQLLEKRAGQTKKFAARSAIGKNRKSPKC